MFNAEWQPHISVSVLYDQILGARYTWDSELVTAKTMKLQQHSHIFLILLLMILFSGVVLSSSLSLHRSRGKWWLLYVFLFVSSSISAGTVFSACESVSQNLFSSGWLGEKTFLLLFVSEWTQWASVIAFPVMHRWLFYGLYLLSI